MLVRPARPLICMAISQPACRLPLIAALLLLAGCTREPPRDAISADRASTGNDNATGFRRGVKTGFVAYPYSTS